MKKGSSRKGFFEDNRINELGLMVVDKNEKEVGHKIALNYLDAKLRIRHALASGKTVLFLPGTYDLLHTGHLVWFSQALQKFTSKMNLKRKDVFSVAPFDNDKLTRIKKIRNHVSQGGREVYLRPIINERNRAVSLANLPYVDLVMPIPSPLDADELLSGIVKLDLKNAFQILKKVELQKKLTLVQAKELKRVLKKYQKMINPEQLLAIKESFTTQGFLASEPRNIYKRIGIDNTLWNNAAWQLVCFLYKMDKEFFENFNISKQKVFRVVSKHDGYTSQVEFIMRLAGIKTLSLREDYITSTTKIISKNNTSGKMDALIASTDPHNYRFW